MQPISYEYPPVTHVDQWGMVSTEFDHVSVFRAAVRERLFFTDMFKFQMGMFNSFDGTVSLYDTWGL
jgi:hypothetical protein